MGAAGLTELTTSEERTIRRGLRFPWSTASSLLRLQPAALVLARPPSPALSRRTRYASCSAHVPGGECFECAMRLGRGVYSFLCLSSLFTFSWRRNRSGGSHTACSRLLASPLARPLYDDGRDPPADTAFSASGPSLLPRYHVASLTSCHARLG